ncbi:hypothetical protein ACI797_09415 [Geodermatophilus sp. SYSU D00691]
MPAIEQDTLIGGVAMARLQKVLVIALAALLGFLGMPAFSATAAVPEGDGAAGTLTITWSLRQGDVSSMGTVTFVSNGATAQVTIDATASRTVASDCPTTHTIHWGGTTTQAPVNVNLNPDGSYFVGMPQINGAWTETFTTCLEETVQVLPDAGFDGFSHESADEYLTGRVEVVPGPGGLLHVEGTDVMTVTVGAANWGVTGPATGTWSLDQFMPGGPTPECSDGFDNDGDGLIDFPDDPDCASAETGSEGLVEPPACADGLDNDGDGKVDSDDPGCASEPFGLSEVDKPACSDLLDNDADGLLDGDDPGCTSGTDNSEENLPACSDGLDNDGDGSIDGLDLGCSGPQDADETDLPGCSDGRDNDGDGHVDFPADPGCEGPQDPNEADCDSEFSRYNAVASAWGEPQFLFSVAVPWCHDGTVAQLHQEIDSVTTEATWLQDTALSRLLDAFVGITLEERPELAEVSARTLPGGALELTAVGYFDACLNISDLVLQALVPGARMVLTRQWKRLTPEAREAFIENIENFIKLPRAIPRQQQEFLLEEVTAALELHLQTFVNKAELTFGQVCGDTWRPRITVTMRPDGGTSHVVDTAPGGSEFWQTTVN